MIPNIIDVEASGFGHSSFPIEIGFILNSGEKYCCLIRPDSGWNHWSADAEKIHQISKDKLQTNGKSVKDVATELNHLLLDKTVYSDGWVVDKPWLTKLFMTAGLNQLFYISPLEFILTEYQMENWHSTKNLVIEELSLTRHRASSDAKIIQETYRRTLIEQCSLKSSNG